MTSTTRTRMSDIPSRREPTYSWKTSRIRRMLCSTSFASTRILSMIFFILLMRNEGQWHLGNGSSNGRDGGKSTTSQYYNFFFIVHADEVTVCTECGVEQNVGRDDSRVPSEFTVKMEDEINAMNDYYNSVISLDSNRLVRPACQNHNELCIFWKVQHRCNSDDYKDFVANSCPLACRLCHHDEYRARQFLQLMWQQLPQEYYPNEHGNDVSGCANDKIIESRLRALKYLMSRLGMDPDLLQRPLNLNDDGNWAEQLHSRLMAIIPPQLLRMYPSPHVEDDEGFRTIVLGTSNAELVPYRSRGYVLHAMLDFDHYVTRPIQLSIGFSILTQSVATEISSLAGTLQKKILQMGAGTGYFITALKQLSKVDTVAYDLHPPAQHQNQFFDWDYSNGTVLPGSCVDVLSSDPTLATTSIILFSWPNDPDPIDNPHFYHQGEETRDEGDCVPSEAVWDVHCLQAYIDAGGDTVVYVGERSDNLSRMVVDSPIELLGADDSGISSTMAFQNLLKDEFYLVKTIPIPRWWLNEDDVTIWRKRSSMRDGISQAPKNKDVASSEL